MENSGVKCDVCQCVHNQNSCRCNLSTVEITCQCGGTAKVPVPHFCKSYQEK